MIFKQGTLKFLLFFSLHLLFLKLSAQIYEPITFPENVNERYIFDPLKEHLEYKVFLKNKIPKKHIEDFSFHQVFGKIELFNDGEIYFGWDATENYLNQILETIIPNELKDKKIKVFIGRSSEINAYCLYDGTMIINVGLLAEVKSEAALVAVMGHELAHFIKQHHINRFIKQLETNKKYKKKAIFEKYLKNSENSQEDENEADKIGFEITKNSGYDLTEALSNFELFLKEKEYYNIRNKSVLANSDSVIISTKNGIYRANTLESLMSTHPELKERMDNLSQFIKKNDQANSVKFKVNEDIFLSLRKQARLECLSMLLNSHNYQECLERSFTYYLFYPNEINFCYYASESLRRLCLIDYRKKNLGFLTERLINNGFKEGEGVLHDIKFIIPDEKLLPLIQAKDLLIIDKTPTFETYKEAFYYFSNKLIVNGNPEGLLQIALFENNYDKIKENVTKYIQDPKSLNKLYAKTYLDNNLSNHISAYNREIVLIPKVDFFAVGFFAKDKNSIFSLLMSIDNRNRYYYKKSEIVGTKLSSKISEHINSTNKIDSAISLSKAKFSFFNTRIKYENALRTTFLASREENDGFKVVHHYKELENEDYVGKVDIFRLDPNLWQFYDDNKFSVLSYAYYKRYTDLSQKTLKNIYWAMSIPSFGITAIIAALKVDSYKELKLYSFNPKYGVVYYNSKIKKRKLNERNAKRMFKKLSKKRDKDIQEYIL
ncbi:MAG: M48 family metallopeptidase [Bacteroidota bacterium]|nr:M48 family metallopeptidase [Bacteroidota bacterium]